MNLLEKERKGTTLEEVKSFVKQVWEEHLRVEITDGDEDFFDMGGDSLMVISILGLINEKYHLGLYVKDLFDHATLNDFSSMVIEKSEGHSFVIEKVQDPAIIYLNEFAQNRKTLFFIHDGTGLIDGYEPLVSRVANDFNCVGINFIYPKAHPECIELKGLAAHYVHKITTHFEAEHYHLLGWSAGAKIALEMTAQLELAHKKVSTFLLDVPKGEEENNQFSLEQEWEWLRSLKMESLRVQRPEELFRDVSSTEDLWKGMIEFLGSEPELFRSVFQHDGDHVEEAVRRFNIIRMLTNAQRSHRFDKRIMSRIYHFVSLDKDGIMSEAAGIFEERLPVEAHHLDMAVKGADLISDKIRGVLA